MSCIRKPGFAGFAVAAVLLFAILTVDAIASGDDESAEVVRLRPRPRQR